MKDYKELLELISTSTLRAEKALKEMTESLQELASLQEELKLHLGE